MAETEQGQKRNELSLSRGFWRSDSKVKYHCWKVWRLNVLVCWGLFCRYEPTITYGVSGGHLSLWGESRTQICGGGQTFKAESELIVKCIESIIKATLQQKGVVLSKAFESSCPFLDLYCAVNGQTSFSLLLLWRYRPPWKQHILPFW